MHQVGSLASKGVNGIHHNRKFCVQLDRHCGSAIGIAHRELTVCLLGQTKCFEVENSHVNIAGSYLSGPAGEQT